MKIVRKVFWAWEHEKEEKWLNEMSAKGLQLYSVGFLKYTFEEGVPDEHSYRIEMVKRLGREGEEYFDFMEETGAECIGTYFSWAYFRKKAPPEEFDLFSDVDSRIAHLNRILLIFVAFGLVNLFLGAYRLYEVYFQQTETSIVLGAPYLLIGAILSYGVLRLLLKKRRLKAERVLHE